MSGYPAIFPHSNSPADTIPYCTNLLRDVVAESTTTPPPESPLHVDTFSFILKQFF